jgi:hypothetical protein
MTERLQTHAVQATARRHTRTHKQAWKSSEMQQPTNVDSNDDTNRNSINSNSVNSNSRYGHNAGQQ